MRHRNIVLSCLALLATSPSARAASRALVVSSDFTTSYYSSLDIAPPFGHVDNIASTCADAVARSRDGRYYILGRLGCDFVQVVDAGSFATLAQWSTGNGTNPQDIVLCSPTKAYVTLYERAFLKIFNPQNGADLGSIDLSAFADADGLPEAAGMAKVGNRVFVALQRLDRPGGFVATNPSLMAVVDCTTDQLVDADPVAPGVQAIALTGRNPFADVSFDVVRQKIIVGEVGLFGVLDGGVEFVDPNTLHAEGFFIDEQALGGDLNAVKLWTDCTGYAIVNDASFRTKLVRFDRCSGQALDTCLQSSGFDLSDVEIDAAHAEVLVADRDFVHPGVRVLRAGSCTQLAMNPVPFGLPPYDLALEEATPTDAAPPAARLALAISNWPDPFNPTTTLRVANTVAGPARLEVLDARGRLVRSLWQGTVGPNPTRVVWDGRDDSGHALASGVYWAWVRTQDEARSERLTLVR